MIQFNLLPSVKLEYMKARRSKHVAMLGAGVVAGVSLLILVLLFLNVQLQAKHSNDLTKDIKNQSKQLQDTQDISSILTVQNQLRSLAALHAGKPDAARLIDYVRQTTPVGVTISGVDTDFVANTISVKGKALDIKTVNIYVDTLKFTTYQSADGNSKGNAFKNVVLSSISTDSSNGSATYEVQLTYDPAIFSNTADVKLTVPDKTTTRSELDAPSLFQADQSGKKQ